MVSILSEIAADHWILAFRHRDRNSKREEPFSEGTVVVEGVRPEIQHHVKVYSWIVAY